MRADLQCLKRDTISGNSTTSLSTTVAKLSAVDATSSGQREATVSQTGGPKWKRWAFAGGGLGLLVIASLIYLGSRPSPPPKVSGYVPVTHDGHRKALVGTDGSRIFFNEYPASVSLIAQVSSSGGEVAHVSAPSPTMSLLAVSPDGANLLVADEVGQTAFMGALGSAGARRLASQTGTGRCLVSRWPKNYLRRWTRLILGEKAMVPIRASSSPRLIKPTILRGHRTEQRFDSTAGRWGLCRLPAVFTRSRLTARTCVLSSPTGTLLPRNVAASGLPTGDISFFSHGAISGLALKKGISLEKPTPNPSS
jgi:hypothetical protein